MVVLSNYGAFHVKLYSQGKCRFFILLTNLKLCLAQFLLLLCNCKDLKNIFCKSIITKPISNSTADKTRGEC